MKLGQTLSALIKKPADGKTAEEKNNNNFKELLAHYSKSANKTPPEKGEKESLKLDFLPKLTLIIRFVASLILLLVAVLVPMPDMGAVALLIIAAAIIGYDIVIRAIEDTKKQYFSSEALPLITAAIISFCLGKGVEAVIALLLLRLGFEARSYAALRIRGALSEEFDFFPKEEFSEELRKFSEGDTAAFDSIIEKGVCTADLSFITGDRASVSLKAGDFIPAGAKCLDGQASLKPLAVAKDSLAEQMSETLKNGSEVLTQTEERLRKISNYFALSAVVLAIIITALIPVLTDLGFAEGLWRGITIIAIASPGAIILSVPFAYYASMAAARRQGIVYSTAKALEKMSRLNSVVFEKKGTLTQKDFIVSDIKTDKMDPATFLKVAAHAQAKADDPVAIAIKAAYGEELSPELIQDFVEYKGRGVSVSVEGINILLGNELFLTENRVSLPKFNEEGYAAHMSVNGIYAGRIILNEHLNPSAPSAMEKLKAAGVERIAMISGDSRERDSVVAGGLGVEEYVAECKPEDRLRRIKEMKARIDSKSTLAYVTAFPAEFNLSDGADLMLSVNGLDHEGSLGASDVTFMRSNLETIADAAKSAFGAKRRVLILISAGAAVKLTIAALAAFGFAPLWFGVTLDMCASLALLIDSISPRRT
jgi:Cd2+/Zn2+-exporting ATPase